MHLGHSNKHYNYYMGSQKVEAVNEEKDLGVLLSIGLDLKPSRQCQHAYSNASKVLGMIGRIITYKDVLLRLYKALVRPHFEYCSSV